jgi:hypothetical protein
MSFVNAYVLEHETYQIDCERVSIELPAGARRSALIDPPSDARDSAGTTNHSKSVSHWHMIILRLPAPHTCPRRMESLFLLGR